MKVFAAMSYEGYVLRMFSTRADAEAFVAAVKAANELHAEWVFSPQHEDFIAPEGLEDFIGAGVDIEDVEEFELY